MRVGDIVRRMTTALGIEACSPCKRRQQLLNRWGENFRSAALGGPNACELARDEAENALALLREQHALGLDVLHVLGRGAEVRSSFFWLAESRLRGVFYGCQPAATFKAP